MRNFAHAVLLTAGFLLATPASAQALYAEGDLALHLPISHLSPGAGLRALVETPLNKDVPLYLGGEIGMRLPGSTSGQVTSPETVATPFSYDTRLTMYTFGGRVAYHIGPEDAFHGRVGAALGLAALFEGTEAPAGKVREQALTVWFRPGGALLFPVGPGHLTANLLVSIAPKNLEVLGDGPGGTNAALAGGYRIPL